MPVTRPFGLRPRLGTYTTLLMASGLTFGSISALYGLTHGYVDQAQYTVLVTVVILSAVVPTLLAQGVYQPRIELGEPELGKGGDGAGVGPQPPPGAEELTEMRVVAGALDE